MNCLGYAGKRKGLLRDMKYENRVNSRTMWRGIKKVLGTKMNVKIQRVLFRGKIMENNATLADSFND